MYTSGSTGQPKGVVVPHRAIARLVINNGFAKLETSDRVAFASNPAFDATTMEVWGALLNGGAIVVIEQPVLLEPQAFSHALQQYRVSVLWLTAGLLNQYVDYLEEAFAKLRYLIVGGDVLDPKVIARVLSRNPPQHLLNGYGPTETTTFAVTHEIQEAGDGATSIPLGRPIANTKVYILDRHKQPVPMGVTGELYIGGDGVALGYLNRPELTAERFVDDCFVTHSNAWLYKTGDLGKWLPDGTIAFAGRNDLQVKIRGFRIELGEIESRLTAHPSVKEAAVLARQDAPGEKRLVAYYTASVALEADALRAHLGHSLPEYMVPAAYVQLQALPLTSNGKVDRKALPAPEADAYASRGYEAPQGELEMSLAALWSDVLKVERVGRQENFFALGGHSLLAVTLIERMRQQGLQVNVPSLFAAPTLAAFAAATDRNGTVGGVAAPPDLIPSPCAEIVPEMLPLVALSTADIARIVAQVPGGAANVQDIYPLAPLQEGILFHHLLNKEGDTYLLSSLRSFDTRARLDRYVNALQAVMERHDILRTSVMWEGLPEPVQVVWRRAPLLVEDVILGDGDAAEQLHERYNPRHHRIDLRQAPLLRAYVAFDRRQGRWLLLELLHHLVGDHAALAVMQHEIQAHLLGQEESLPLPLPFRNFVAQARLGVSKEEHERFFKEMLGDIDEPTAPFGLLNVQGDGSDIAEARCLLDAQLARRLRQQARQLGVSTASLCHLAWAQVLARVSGRTEVVFGTVLFGRMQAGAGADRVMGLFINTLPVRLNVGQESVQASARRTHATLAELVRHEHASLALAQRCSAIAAPAPLFSSLLNYRHSATTEPSDETRRAWEGIAPLRNEERTNYPFDLSVDDLGDGFGLTAQVQGAVDPKRVCQMMHTALERLVDALEAAPQTPLMKLDVLPESERRQLLVDWNQTQQAFPRDKCIHELFEAQAARYPNAPAVIHEAQRLDYGLLNAKANQLAHHLRELGVKPNDRVAICVDRSVEMIVGLLAVLKAGGCYVPLDPAHPQERLLHLLQDTSARLVLTQTRLVSYFSGQPRPALVLDRVGETPWARHPDSNLERGALTPADLAYVIYTSGSTGTPKGVMIEHRSVCNQISFLQKTYRLQSQDRCLQFAALSFDVSVGEIFGALSSGAALVLRTDRWLADSREFWRLAKEHEVTVFDLPTRFWQLLAEDETLAIPNCVRLLIIGGESVEQKSLEAWFQRKGHRPRLLNGYGPTEATVQATMEEPLGAAAWRSIGRPVANTRVYILDDHGQPVPIGVTGELYIGGVGVARGYLNRPELTAERFVRDSFSDEAAARLYKTGDLGRWLPDGTIEFLGRNDFQVKLRGFRIELGEIEARLSEHEAVREAVVLAREDEAGEKRLVAYYTCVDSGRRDEELIGDLRKHLLKILPSTWYQRPMYSWRRYR
jgi:amino acid adenylation domain-containing protein